MENELFARPENRPDERPRLFADVVVRERTRTAGPFSYAVPEKLRPHIVPGQIVWVPVRKNRVQGLVVSLSEHPPDFETREVEEIAELEPVLTGTQLALGRWMADYYMAGLGDALFAMLPPGLLRRTRTLVTLTEAGRNRSLEGLSPISLQIIAALRQAEGELDTAALSRAVERRTMSDVLTRLANRGWLTLTSYTEEPQARPHLEPFLVLTATAEAIGVQRQQLWTGRRDSVRARVLEALVRATGGTRELKGLQEELKTARTAIALLEESGLVSLEKEEQLLCLAASAGQVAAFLEKQGQRAPQQAALLRELIEAGGRTAPNPTTAGARRALEQQGFVRMERRPARVRLSVLPEVAREQAASLRRTLADERQLAILDELERAGDRALPLSALYRIIRGAGREDIEALVTAGLGNIEDREVLRDPLAGQEIASELPPVLTERQGQVWREIYEAFSQPSPRPFLLHGVTGSGKTELYLRALGRVLRDGKQALVLVPEISLTPQTVRRFAARFPGRVTVLHSGLTVGERYDQWRRVRQGQVDVVIGPRSALFAPLPRLGLIIVDEEHESSYKQDDMPPRYHARETALALARLTGSLVIMGSATPSADSYLRARQGTFRLLELPDRIRVRRDTGGSRLALPDTSLPRVQVVDMREELQAGNTGIFSRDLQRALKMVLLAQEQAILFLNRRGSATFVMCRNCGHVVRCPRCDVAYVYHAETAGRETPEVRPGSAGAAGQAGILVCHRCGRQARMPQVCPECGSAKIRHFGAGTERVVEETLRLFPQARVLRWDRDVTRERHAQEEILDAFLQHEADILVGTQMIAKGLDLPLVTLVGVISADTALHLPDFRSAERTFQLVTQVVGRAGRREERGRAIVQTYHPEHYAIQAAARQEYGLFIRQEMSYRERHGYPPLQQMARLVYCHAQENHAQEEARRLAGLLQERLPATPGARLIGPAPAFLSRLRGAYRWQLLLLAPDVHAVLKGLQLPEGWEVDVDPVSLLG